MWQCRSPRRSSSSHELRQRALQRRFQLAPALAQLRRDPRQPEPLVDALLGRAARRLAGLVVEHPVLGDVQPAPDRPLAQLHVVGLGAGEVLEHVAELIGRDDLHVDLHARVRVDPRTRLAGGMHGIDQLQLAQRVDQRGRVRRRGDDVDVLGAVAEPAQRARDLHPVGRRVIAQRAGDLLGDRQRAGEQDARRRAAALLVVGERAQQVLLDLGAEPAQLADLTRLGDLAQLLQRVDVQLVIEQPRALRAEARQVHDGDQPGRELRAQLHGGGDVARLVQRAQLLLERLADARQRRHLALARQAHHRHRRLADGLGRRAVGDHAVGDRAVELIQVAELIEGGGDLRVRLCGHG